MDQRLLLLILSFLPAHVWGGRDGAFRAPSTAAEGPGKSFQAVATRIYHWGESKTAPPGTPQPPGSVPVMAVQPIPPPGVSAPDQVKMVRPPALPSRTRRSPSRPRTACGCRPPAASCRARSPRRVPGRQRGQVVVVGRQCRVTGRGRLRLQRGHDVAPVGHRGLGDRLPTALGHVHGHRP